MASAPAPRTLVLNLTRFGDVIQSQPLVSGLAARGERVDYVCLDNFHTAAALLDHVGAIHPLPGSVLLSATDSDWRSGVGTLWQWLREVRGDLPPQRVVNLTPSLPGRLLSRLVAGAGAAQNGLSLDGHGFACNTSAWAAFLQLASVSRGASPFNLVDVFCRVGGLAPGERRFRLRPPTAAVPQLLTLGLPAGARGYVGLQLGASEERRRWPLEFFARLGQGLWEKSACVPVLLGGPGERPLAERYAALVPGPHVDLVGRTSLQELAAVLAGARLLVTNDTGTMHLAAGLATPILAIFLCTAQPWDTGPYAPGSLCLEPNMACHPCAFGAPCPHQVACRRAIAPESVLTLTTGFLDRGQWPDGETLGARVWRSGLDTGHFLVLEPQGDTGQDDRYRWIMAQRHVLRRFLDGQELAAMDHGEVEPLSPAAGGRLATVLAEAGGVLDLLCAQGQVLQAAPREILKQKFLAMWQRLQAVLEAEPMLAVVGRLLVAQAADAGDDLAALVALFGRYRELLAAFLPVAL